MASASDPDRARMLAKIVYALQGMALVIGFTYFIGALISHLQLRKAAGTWLESHFRWQIHTFWLSLAIGAAGALALNLGPAGIMIIVADLTWVVFRIIQGWVRLNGGRPVGRGAA
jgi:uncharacterized membrane protein